MTTTDGELTFVVIGEPPAAFAVAAARVRTVLPAASFSGQVLDLATFSAVGASDEAAHVLLLGAGADELALGVKGHLSLLTLEASAVLPLPPLLQGSSGMSHLLAPRGVPLMFVLDLARLDRAGTSRGASQPCVAVTET
jgi:hypothetical protein